MNGMKEDDLVVIYGKEDWSRVIHSGVLTIQFMDEDCTIHETSLAEIRRTFSRPKCAESIQAVKSPQKRHNIQIMQPSDNAPIVVKVDNRFYQCRIQSIEESLKFGHRFWLKMKLSGIEPDEAKV